MAMNYAYVRLGSVPGGANKKFLVTLLSGFIIGVIATFIVLQNTSYFAEMNTRPNWMDSRAKFEDPHSHGEFDPGPTIKGNVGEHASNEDFHKDEDLVAKELERRVRVLCWVLTSPSNHETRAKHVKATWGKRCNILVFVSTANDTTLGAIALSDKEGHDLLWIKTKAAFTYVYQHYKDAYDWVLKADDDTYVVVENLRYLLYHYNSSDPMYFGCRFKPYVKQGYMSGGAGYVLSKEAVHRFVTQAIPNPKLCKEEGSGAEDVEIGKCLENVGVIAMDSRDQYERGRFFPFTPENHLFNRYDPSYWYYQYIYYNTTDGLNCCSDLAITFHYISPQQLYVMDYMIYHLRPYGIHHRDDLNILPDKATQ
ncbi:glycoprotein-N-acetylgalactosamine 3-beta-galactosyltransferase 1-like [Macrosteles quadrilineatus]|uniref:glycoprotein-N-acetylgalactosamine 3-beta-galactosyltransferase 1-like n=1 Tax=Macrosteles quadrilineatus TaxID=74068 RepID=UPI0023E1BC28|nr:glycoprotein-N-acetylgalactosamine 3-beta-galactosyltransferase 1-like [Macrosteles quadrilineatus]